MDLGFFLPIGNNGWVVSATAPQYMPTFELNKSMTQRAEAAGLEFVLSMGKWRGFGGTTEHWDHTVESMTLMAGLASVTSRIQLFATVHPLLFNPAVAAKMVTTIDDISGGRAGINLVTGWNKWEFSQMGMWPGDDYYDVRYEYAAEWVTIVKELWTTGRSSFRGRFFSMEDCMGLPRPQRRPHPPIVCAGMSDPGLRFTTRHCDYGFLGGGPWVADLLDRSKRMGAELGRKSKNIVLYTVVAEATDEAAEARVAYYKSGADIDAIRGYADAASNDAHGTTSKGYEEFAFLTQTMGGSYDSVVAQLEEHERMGADGVLFAVADPVRDVDLVIEEILPRMERAGLRKPARSVV
jgi:pyrimidine oxygenase